MKRGIAWLLALTMLVCAGMMAACDSEPDEPPVPELDVEQTPEPTPDETPDEQPKEELPAFTTRFFMYNLRILPARMSAASA